LFGPLAHEDHPLRHLYPIWKGNLSPTLLPEELRAPRPVTYGELVRETLYSQTLVLGPFQNRMRTSGFVNVAIDFELTPVDMVVLASLFAPSEYIVTGLADRTARLLRLEQHGVAMLSPTITDGRLSWGKPTVMNFSPLAKSATRSQAGP
jgi:hypothetical protein